MSSCGLSEAIQSLPPELREMIFKEYIATKIKEKKGNGVGQGTREYFKTAFLQIQAADCVDGDLSRIYGLLFRGLLFSLFRKGCKSS